MATLVESNLNYDKSTEIEWLSKSMTNVILILWTGTPELFKVINPENLKYSDGCISHPSKYTSAIKLMLDNDAYLRPMLEYYDNNRLPSGTTITTQFWN